MNAIETIGLTLTCAVWIVAAYFISKKALLKKDVN